MYQNEKHQNISLNRVLAATVALLCLTACNKEEKAAPPAAAQTADSTDKDILRADPALDELVPKSAQLEKIAGGFQFIEGPLWFPAGHLWFSDVKGNVVLQWAPDGKISTILKPGGDSKDDAPPGSLIGPNGMVHGPDGATLICQHGNRRIISLSSSHKVSTLVDRFQGKRFSSPNDLVFKSDGSLYFTDPPYGLLKEDSDPKKELSFNGVFRLHNKKVEAVIKDLTRPNGIAFSPDQKVLYISNSDEKRKVWMRYDVMADGSVSNGQVLYDATASTDPGLPDGMKLDEKGNLYGAGPGGIWVISPAGKHLGTIKMPETPANCNWGDDGKTLYITATSGLYRIKLGVAGEKTLYE